MNRSKEETSNTDPAVVSDTTGPAGPVLRIFRAVGRNPGEAFLTDSRGQPTYLTERRPERDWATKAVPARGTPRGVTKPNHGRAGRGQRRIRYTPDETEEGAGERRLPAHRMEPSRVETQL